MADACATCAASFGRESDPASEKPLLPGRCLPCCRRSICSPCLNQNKRYETYCPYCQITTEPSLLPQGLKDPPAYSSLDDRIPPPIQPSPHDDELPAYSESQPKHAPSEKAQPSEDVLHFLKPNDSLHSLSLAYGVPTHALRKANNVFSDHLVQGRKTVIIPGDYYKGGVSLSPQPVESAEEELRKNKTRRWMMACKVAEYDVALLYLKQSGWDLDAAIEAFREDEQWEKDHPLDVKSKKQGKMAKNAGMRRFVGAGTSVISSRVR